MLGLLMILGILMVLILPLMAMPDYERRVKPSERRAADKAYRKERRERAEQNAGAMVDKDGNMILPNKEGNTSPPVGWHVRRYYEVAKARLKPNYIGHSAKSTFWHGRMVAYEHDTPVVMACAVLLLGAMSLLMINGYYMAGMGLTLIPIMSIGAGVRPKEILGTGFVDAVDDSFGATNNSAKLDAVIAFANANDRRRIYLGRVTWAIATKVVIPHTTEDWVIMGYTQEMSILDSSIISDNVIETDFDTPHRVDNIMLSHFQVSGSGTDYVGICLFRATIAHMDHILISGCGRDGCSIEYTYGGSIRNSEMTNNSLVHTGYDGIQVRHSNAITFDTVRLTNQWGGIKFYYAKKNTMIGCVIETSDVEGIRIISPSNNNTFLSNYFEQNGTYDIVIYYSAAPDIPTCNEIAYNYLTGSGGAVDYGILLWSSYDTKIHHNRFREHNICAIKDGHTSGGSYRTTITDNSVKDTTFLITSINSHECYVGKQTFDGTTTTYITNASPTLIVDRFEIGVITTDAIVTNGFVYTMGDNSAIHIEAQVIAMQSDGSDRNLYRIEALYYRDGGAATQQGATTAITSIESEAACNCVFSTNGNDVELELTGVNPETWNWKITMNVSPVD